MQLTLRQLLYFVTSVDSGSITRAAETLHVAPTALSQQIKAIEDNFGTTLLERHSRGIEPTEAGRDLYLRSRQVLDLVAETENAMRRKNSAVTETITLGLAPAIARMIGSDVLLGASSRFENIRLHMLENWSSDLFDRMLEGEIDYVLGYDMQSNAKVKSLDLVNERFVYASSAALSPETGPIPLREALAQPLIFYGENSVSWRAARLAAKELGVEVNVGQVVTSIEVWRQLIIRGLGATIVPVGALRTEQAAGRVVVREILGGPVQLRIALAATHEAFAKGMGNGFVPFLLEIVSTCYSQYGRHFSTLLPDALAQKTQAKGDIAPMRKPRTVAE